MGDGDREGEAKKGAKDDEGGEEDVSMGIVWYMARNREGGTLG
jgi:hypothetical protein